ncbi:RDD family protein [Herbiconiux sp. A18JL235]|uniref:RDD family protein n=1 Tax=Herbiconiux sp. A18JL235 TaxID=3152363 RepID=A0AB39BHD0_9MICO
MTDASFPCAQCGSAVPRSAQFCLVCGTPVSSRSQTSALGAQSLAGAPATVGADGRPIDGWQPTPAAPPIRRGDLFPANYGRRVVAFLLDGAVGLAFWLLVTMPLIALGVIEVQTDETRIGVSGLSAVLLIVPALVYPLAKLLMQSFLGFSVGKLALGLRIVNVGSLGRPGLGWMLLRDVFVAAASLVFFIGQYVVYLSPLWDSEKIGRGWHDRLARTWVIDVKAGPNPLKAAPGQLVLDASPRAAELQPEPAGFGGGRAFTPGNASSQAAQDAGYGRGGQDAAPAPGTPVAEPSGVPVAPPPPAPPAPGPVPQYAAPGYTPGGGAGSPVPPPPPGAPAEPIDVVPGFAPAPVVTPAELAAAFPASDAPADAEHDDAEHTRLSQPPVSARAAGVTAFRLDSGAVVPVTRHGVLGRDPVSPSNDPRDILIALTGDTLSVSKTHLEFDVEPGGVWVSDRGSTNGSAIVRADGAELQLEPGERITLENGDRVRVGTRYFTVEGAL